MQLGEAKDKHEQFGNFRTGFRRQASGICHEYRARFDSGAGRAGKSFSHCDG